MGLLGGGAALIIIPAVIMILHFEGLAPNYAMQIAVGTFFAIAIVMLSSSVYTHHKYNAIEWGTFAKMLGGIILGTLLGGIIASYISTQFLKYTFAIFSLIITFWLAFYSDSTKTIVPSKKGFFGAGYFLGFISGIVGIGTLTVPFLKKCGLDIRNSVATSSACSLVIGIIGAITYIVMGWNITDLPSGTIGYVYYPIFLPMAVTSLIFSPIGAKISHVIPKKALKTFYCILTLIVSIKMLL